MVSPTYEVGQMGRFCNNCVVGAIETILGEIPDTQKIVALEVGAGTGSTASSVLPLVNGRCLRYVFTDVSEVFLVKARARFTEYDFIDYMLLNIDADPRLQSLGSREFHIVVSTNCLHATPFMTNTLRYCHQLLCPGGFLVANEAVRITAFSQITFGLTDGWWLFAEVEDPERIGQESPLLSWRQWEAILEAVDSLPALQNVGVYTNHGNRMRGQ